MGPPLDSDSPIPIPASQRREDPGSEVGLIDRIATSYEEANQSCLLAWAELSTRGFEDTLHNLFESLECSFKPLKDHTFLHAQVHASIQ